MKRQLVLAALVSIALTATSHAQINISVFPSIGPNFNGSPNFGGYSYNAINALYPGAQSPVLAPGTQNNPAAAYSQLPLGSSINVSNVIATQFNSWKGVAPPGAQFAGEVGNLLYFGAKFEGAAPGQQFMLSQVAANINISDPALNYGGNFPLPTTFSANRVGVLRGADNQLGTADDVFITSGPDQAVDALYYVGEGVGYDATAFANQSGTPQDILNAGIQEILAANPNGVTFNIDGQTYTVTPNGQLIGPGGAILASVPEPASMAVLGAGLFGLFGYALRKRRLNAKVA